MEDISIELWNKIEAEYNALYSESKEVKRLYEKLVNGVATYEDATAYAEEVGSIWSKALGHNLNIETLPDGKLYFNIANKTIRPALVEDYEAVAEFTEQLQNLLNQSAKIGLKSVVPKINDDRIRNLIDKIASQYDVFSSTDWLIGSDVLANYSRAVVSDFVEENAKLQKDAGLHSWIERIEGAGGCCDWCRRMVGKYTYGEQPDDFFRVHKDCTCSIEFHPSKRAVQRISYKDGKRIVTTI